MTNRDTFTPAPVGKFMFEEVDQRWHHIKNGEAQFTEPRLPMVKLYGEETVRKLLEERDADKKPSLSFSVRSITVHTKR
ncbi:hypothetical protein [Kosakonia cowanii]|uniref:hypothetical protein n=1 Tax=Kosakonia cowanii TaxID=208223 RepID=UPI0039A76260